MTTAAVESLPAVDLGLGLELIRFLVAIAARCGNVCAGQDEPRLFVLGEGEGGGLVAIYGVAAIASVEIRRGDELTAVLVGVAVGAVVKFDFEQRVLPFWDMTLVAIHAGMTTFEWIGAGGVLLHREGRGLPPLHRVTVGAFDPAGPLGELSIVRIGLVAVGTFIEGQRFLEVAAGMALLAADLGMFPFQRILGFGVVEVLAQLRCRDLLPSRRRMACRAGLLEGAVMRIRMAIRAFLEGNAGVARLPVRTIGVALLALYFGMQPGQWISRLGVIELADVDLFPVFIVVALQAVLG